MSEQGTWVADPEDGRMVCSACGYNQPHHRHACRLDGKTDLERRLAYANMSDAQVREACTRCGHRIGCGGAVIAGGGLAHKFDCTRPGTWA